MNVLVIGSGAREHAICWKLAQSPKVSAIFCAPGNAGTLEIAQNIPVDPADINGLVKAALDNNIYLTVVGPEVPLAKGIVDHFVIRGMQIFGPIQAAAQLESSKAFAKQFMLENGIPTASSQTFSDYHVAAGFLEGHPLPVVIKADGLSQGKGVFICRSWQEADRVLKTIMVDKIFGDAGDSVIIEEYLEGRELSAFSFSDAHSASEVVSACDYKRVFDGNQGPNTGGMGAFSPADFFTPELSEFVSKRIMEPVIKTMHDSGRPYKGILYAGLMLTGGGPRVLEFNARFGDPETQVVLPRLQTDLFDIMVAICNNQLYQYAPRWSDKHTVGVVVASKGYPGKYSTGFKISGLSDVDNDIMVFHAGTRLSESGDIVTSGGRVLTVVAEGESLEKARQKVYDNVSRIGFEGSFYRRDIALVENI